MLVAAGFTELKERDSWSIAQGGKVCCVCVCVYYW